MDMPRTVVITGASAGVGRATAHAFARTGAHIGLIARDAAALEEVRGEVEALGGQAIALPADVADAKAVEAAASRTEDAFGPIDVWVNNAMATVFSPVKDLAPEELHRVTEVTYYGQVHGTMAALRRMRRRDRGRIIQVGSALAYRGIPLQAAYCAAKHAVVGFTDSLRCELIHDGSNVKLTTVHLPAMNTPQFSWARTRFSGRPQPVGPIVQPEEAADAIVWASEHGGRELWVGTSTMQAVLGQMAAPGLMDRYLARNAYEAQSREEPLPAGYRDNLFEPVSGVHATRGAFDARADAPGRSLRAGTVRALLAGAGLALAAGMLAGTAMGTARRVEEREHERTPLR
ncbi:SDR family oxidoreductase [Azospirillum sp. SYSU D00513]|uniref:SDR family oxidoreductase n=1 Tax=Azospirillum sp. SYSU D00513 TaxID=2812561 RepID=UPI001A96DBC1|nr:SDR family oxidoreductase [Azospirillum sp. SYSU D00513]